MSKEIIPISLSQEISLSDSEKKEFTRRRKSLVSELRCITGLPEVVSALNQEKVTFSAKIKHNKVLQRTSR